MKKSAPTVFRGFRLPRSLDASTLTAARQAETTQTAIIIRILAEAVRRGDLPQPKTKDDAAQLKFL